MKTLVLLALTGMAGAIPSAMAQERAAGGALETQMSWSALQSMINANKAQTDAAHARIDQVVVCGKKGMVYAPGAPGIDGEGCKAGAGGSTTIVNNNTEVTKVVDCAKIGKLYVGTDGGGDSSGCKDIEVPVAPLPGKWRNASAIDGIMGGGSTMACLYEDPVGQPCGNINTVCYTWAFKAISKNYYKCVR